MMSSPARPLIDVIAAAAEQDVGSVCRVDDDLLFTRDAVGVDIGEGNAVGVTRHNAFAVLDQLAQTVDQVDVLFEQRVGERVQRAVAGRDGRRVLQFGARADDLGAARR